jgi:hypothetical protein
MVNKPAIEWKNLSTGCLVAITQGLVFAVRSIGPLPASKLKKPRGYLVVTLRLF